MGGAEGAETAEETEPVGGRQEITEGRTRLRVPPSPTERGPAARQTDVFFNPAMALSRDLGVLAVRALAAERGRPVRALDGLAAGGARGLRYAVEGGAEVTLNDWSADAALLAQENAALNAVPAHVTRRSVGALLWEGTWDLVDVDPFGSPAPFVDAATRAVAPGGVLALTATDTAALYGAYPEVCRRRYLADPLRCEFGHEVALRILAGFATRQAAKHDVGLVPLLAHLSDHAYRLYARAARGAARANAAVGHLGYAWLCGTCAERGLAAARPAGCSGCGGGVRVGGPLWTGPLHDPGFLAGMLEGVRAGTLAREEQAIWLLTLLAGEADAPGLFWDAHEAAGRAGVNPWPLPALLAALLRAGHPAARSHASPWGIKTGASAAQLAAVLRGDREQVYREIEAFERDRKAQR